MSFEKLIRLKCEADHCERWIYAPRVQSVQLARRSVREFGWTFTQVGGDRCEFHPVNDAEYRYARGTLP